ncbi:MAG: hypothetical protein ACFBRM_07375 [Pikeienuella sp.]
MRALIAAAVLSLLAAPEALAHRLLVFAFVEGETVVVESKFSNGRIPASGTVIVYDGTEVEIGRHAVGENGTARFPLDPRGRETGLRIEVTTGRAHSDYWVLTPEDIAKGGAD